MATAATPYGARPIGSLSVNGSYTGKVRHYPIASGYATSIFHGDFVKLVTAGTIERDVGTTALTTCGIFMGVEYTDSNNEPKFMNYWPASTVATNIKAMVMDDPFVVFRMQADESVAQTAVGANAAVVSGSGSTTFGTSDNALDGSSVATTNTLPLRIIGFTDDAENGVGDAFTDCICIFNTTAAHQYMKILGV